jgi:hypothetical protein
LRPGTTPMTRTRLERGTPLRAAGRPSKRFAARREPKYCAWIRTLPCLLAGRTCHDCYGPVECCHVVSRGAGGYDRGNTFPACRSAHRYQHRAGIRTFEARYALDLAALATQLEARWVLASFTDERGSGVRPA